jgi:hypothetical protein
MAFTLAKSVKTVLGNQRIWMGVITADAAEAELDFGFSNLTGVQVTAKSAASAPNLFSINEDSSGVASAGILGVSGVASGDDFNVIVYGV